MKVINCPLNGPRNAQEFICGGEVKRAPTGDDTDIRQWADYIFMEDNLRGVVQEWWCHVASGYWFIAERNTVSDTILRTYASEDLIVHPARPGSGTEPGAEQ